ncbi:MAG: NAD-dependent epimerase/dehydratase family protein, partial [Nitrospirae bacterium]
MVKREFWEQKKVFITGHTGFKGGWLATWLLDMGSHVYGYALKPDSDPSYFTLCGLENRMCSIVGDIRNPETLRNDLIKSEPEIVIHLAAKSLVRRSYKEPVETFGTNVMGTVHLLEAVRRAPSVRVVVIVTSDKCYENREWVWGYREEEAMGGHDPYSA